MIFISCSFDPYSKKYGKMAHSLFQQYGVDAYIAEHPEPRSLVNVLKTKVQEAEALVALVTDKESPWQQTEITWAHDMGKPVYGIVQDGVIVRGMLPYITKYEIFVPTKPDTLQSAIGKVVNSIASMREDKQMQTGIIAGLAILGLFILSKNK